MSRSIWSRLPLCFFFCNFCSKAYFARPYTFIGLGVFCLMCNMLGMISLAYHMREFKQVRFHK